MEKAMPTWEEWNVQLSQEQRDYSLFKILESMDSKLSTRCATCAQRLKDCEDRFKTIEKRKWIDRACSAGGGVVGGFMAVIGLKAFK